MDGEYRQRINIELTESEAGCLMSDVLSNESTEQDYSAMAAMIFSRLVGTFPNLMVNDRAVSFLKRNGYEYDPVSNDKSLIPWDILTLKAVEKDLQNRKRYIKAELAKLTAKTKAIESKYILQVLREDSLYPTEGDRHIEIWCRLKADMDYNLTNQKKGELKKELKNISDEIAAIYMSAKAD